MKTFVFPVTPGGTGTVVISARTYEEARNKFEFLMKSDHEQYRLENSSPESSNLDNSADRGGEGSESKF